MSLEQPQERPINELLSKSLVDIYVGPDSTHWILHEKLLCHHSPYFRQIFYGTKGAPTTSQHGLPDEDPDAFNVFVGWLYSNLLPAPAQENDLGVLFELYLMAAKWRIGALQRATVDRVRRWYADTDSYPGLRRVQYVYANTADPNDPMRALLVKSVARMLVLAGEGIPPHWDKALRNNGQLAVDIIGTVRGWGIRGEEVPDVRKGETGGKKEGDEGRKQGDEGRGEEVQQQQQQQQQQQPSPPSEEQKQGKLLKELPNGLSNGDLPNGVPIVDGQDR